MTKNRCYIRFVVSLPIKAEKLILWTKSVKDFSANMATLKLEVECFCKTEVLSVRSLRCIGGSRVKIIRILGVWLFSCVELKNKTSIKFAPSLFRVLLSR